MPTVSEATNLLWAIDDGCLDHAAMCTLRVNTPMAIQDPTPIMVMMATPKAVAEGQVYTQAQKMTSVAK